MFLVLGSISLCLGCLCLYGVCGVVVLVVVFGAVDWICVFVGLRFKCFVWFELFDVLAGGCFGGYVWYVCFRCCFDCLIVLGSCFFCDIVVMFKVGC